jgi:hypothetical protein
MEENDTGKDSGRAKTFDGNATRESDNHAPANITIAAQVVDRRSGP